MSRIILLAGNNSDSVQYPDMVTHAVGLPDPAFPFPHSDRARMYMVFRPGTSAIPDQSLQNDNGLIFLNRQSLVSEMPCGPSHMNGEYYHVDTG